VRASSSATGYILTVTGARLAFALSAVFVFGACAHTPENVSYGDIASQAEGRTMVYSVYTPPGWDGETPLPLVVFLHGAGDDETVLEEKAQVAKVFDEWIEAGRVDPFIMVAPDGERGFWANWYDGSHSYEDYVVDEIIPEMYARYPIAPGRENLHLMGISMGGAGTMYTTLHHIDRFASATVLSAPIFDVEQTMAFLEGKVIRGIPVERLFGPPNRDKVERSNPFVQLQTPEDLHGTQLFLGVGRVDLPGLLGSNRELHEHLEQRGVPHHYLEYRGGHGWRSWAQIFPVALCLHMRGNACALEPDRFYTLDRDPEVRERLLASLPGSGGA
jgi:enterochelin esterase-like enzyme